MRKRVEVTIAPVTAQALQMATIVLSGEAKVTDNWNLEVPETNGRSGGSREIESVFRVKQWSFHSGLRPALSTSTSVLRGG